MKGKIKIMTVKISEQRTKEGYEITFFTNNKPSLKKQEYCLMNYQVKRGKEITAMHHFKKYWELHGTRRPFPALYEAVEMYGAENVYFDKPTYEKENQCPWCGKAVNNKRRRFCCDTCRENYNNATVWNRGRDAYSLRILYRDNFTCQDCGEFHALINNFDMPVPIDDGQLEVHHILPVSKGGGDEQQNLITLCKKCHKKRHKDMKEKE